MAMFVSMSNLPGQKPEGFQDIPTDSTDRSATDDLTAGLGLILKAARKVVQDVETKTIEELGRRSFARIDRLRLEELGRKAKEKLDPRRIEELAEDAGRELFRAVESVAERVESLLGREDDAPRSRQPPAPTSGTEPPKVRVKEEE